MYIVPDTGFPYLAQFFMATKKIEAYTTPELEKMAKNHKLIFGIFIGMFIVYFGLILMLIYLGKSSLPNMVSFFALIPIFIPIYVMMGKVEAELRRRETVWASNTKITWVIPNFQK